MPRTISPSVGRKTSTLRTCLYAALLPSAGLPAHPCHSIKPGTYAPRQNNRLTLSPYRRQPGMIPDCEPQGRGLEVITSSNLVGCSTGMSATLMPRKRVVIYSYEKRS